MITKLAPRRFFWTVFITLLIGCSPTQPNISDIQTKVVAMAKTNIALTQTALPTATPPLPTVTPTATADVILSTSPPTPTTPPILTPDAIQVERWKEYQTELAKALFVYNPSFPSWRYGPEVSTDALCEWDILGRSDQEVYVLAVCISADSLSFRENPAVIYFKSDGSIQEVNVASEEISPPGSPYLAYDLHLFPTDIQEKLCLFYFLNEVPQCHDITPAYHPSIRNYSQSRQRVLKSHLEYRKIHPEEPPLVILSAASTATSTP